MAREKIARTCEICGGQFFVNNHRAKSTTVRFCSQDCRRQRPSTLTERFWRGVKRTESCWIWQRTKTSYGYGMINERGKPILTHRLSWEIHNSPIPEGMYILHKCDNPPCVRPDHLFLGTCQDNMLDKEKKGRGNQKRGEEQGLHKLTEAEVREIRRLRAAGHRVCQIARMFRIHQSNVSIIVAGKTWRHVE